MQLTASITICFLLLNTYTFGQEDEEGSDDGEWGDVVNYEPERYGASQEDDDAADARFLDREGDEELDAMETDDSMDMPMMVRRQRSVMMPRPMQRRMKVEPEPVFEKVDVELEATTTPAPPTSVTKTPSTRRTTTTKRPTTMAMRLLRTIAREPIAKCGRRPRRPQRRQAPEPMSDAEVFMSRPRPAGVRLRPKPWSGIRPRMDEAEEVDSVRGPVRLYYVRRGGRNFVLEVGATEQREIPAAMFDQEEYRPKGFDF